MCGCLTLPYVLSSSDDMLIKLWDCEKSWFCTPTLSPLPTYREKPVASMDNSGKIICFKHYAIQTINIKNLGANHEVSDGELLPLAVKESRSCDIYPQSLKQNIDGKFVVVCGDDECPISVSLAWRNRSFGSTLEFFILQMVNVLFLRALLKS